MSKPRILIVDDDAGVLAAFRIALRRDRERWDCAFAESGEAAIVQLDASEFDVVISDMHMSGIDGEALLAHVKAHAPNTIRIMLSGSAMPDLAAHVSWVVHELIAKPCGTKALREVIERWLGRARLEPRVAEGALR